jgi:putative DNA primase/helicase
MGFALNHLSEPDRIRIARGLFKVTHEEEAKGELHGLCPIHGESNPSFSYNYHTDLYNCFSCGASGDLLRLWSEVHGHGQKEGFKAFCEEFGISHGGDQKNRSTSTQEGSTGSKDSISHETAVEQMRIAWEKFPSLPEVWLQRLENERGWSRECVEILDLRLQTFFLNKKGNLSQIDLPERIAIPIRDDHGDLINIRLYKPGAKQHKIISWAATTGKSQLFPAKPLKDGTVLLCEGESDTICALSHGFNAITQTSKLKNWPDNHLKQFKGRDVIIAYDADQPGQKYAGFAAKALAGTAKSIQMIQWPSFMGIDEAGAYPKDHGDDLTDFLVRYGKTAVDLQVLLDNGIVFVKANEPADTPPSDDQEDSILQFFEYGINKRFSFKPRLLAEKILSDYSLLSDPDTGILYKWNGKFWEPFEEDHIRSIAIRCMQNESQKSRIEDAVYQVKMLATIPHGRKVNDQEEWVCLQNGMLNFMTFELKSHDRDFYCTHALPVALDPESTKRCERFEHYLAQTIETPQSIAQAQEFAGYCVARHTKFEKCLFLLGPGSDGKSTFMKVLKEIIGAENCAAVSFPDLENEFHRSSLYNKLLNISTEIGNGEIESPYFKAITSGDPINAAFKHRDAFTFSPYCKLIFAGNTLPRVRDNSDGYFRRILPIQFKHQFLEDNPDRDPDLMDKLKEELSEIFFWMLCGLKRLTEQRRFTDSDETRDLLMGYRRSNNPVLCYVEDECVLGEDKEVSKTDIYKDYQGYCGKNGYKAFNRENFFREIYMALHNLKRYRPRVNGTRETKLIGIGILGEYNKDSN